LENPLTCLALSKWKKNYSLSACKGAEIVGETKIIEGACGYSVYTDIFTYFSNLWGEKWNFRTTMIDENTHVII